MQFKKLAISATLLLTAAVVMSAVLSRASAVKAETFTNSAAFASAVPDLTVEN